MSSKAALFVVTALAFLTYAGPAAVAQSGDVNTARIEGTWRLTVHIDSYVNSLDRTPATGDPPAGHEEDQLVVFTQTCPAPGQCIIGITDVNGKEGFVGASGFAGPIPGQIEPFQQSGATYQYRINGFGGGPCSVNSAPGTFASQIDITVVAATQDVNGSVATSLSGSEDAIVGSCPDPAGNPVFLDRHLTITQAVAVPATTTTAVPTTAAGTTPTSAAAGGSKPAALIDRENGPAPIATTLEQPSDAFGSLGRTAANVAIAAAFMFLIVFPADLFNKTFDENHDEIRAGWERRVRWLRERRQQLTEEAVARRRPLTFVSVVVLGAILGGLLNPHFGVNRSSAASLLAALSAFVVAAVVSGLVAAGYRKKRKYELEAHPKALPAGLLIAAVCVLISRVSSFEPGYLYGVVVGIAFTAELDKKEEGRLVALDSLTTLAVAVLAWLIWVPVNKAALHAHPGFPTVFLDDFLGSLFVAGLVGTVLGLFPLSFMPGHKLASWHRGAWAAVFGIAVFGLLQIILLPASDSSDRGSAPIATAVVLFILFGAVSVGFAAYWSRRKKQQTAAAYAGVASSIVGVDPDEE